MAASVAIVSRAMARRFWPTEGPVGRTLRYGQRPVTVVGVVGDVRQERLDVEGQPAIFVPQLQDPRRGFTLVIRTNGDPRAVAPTVRRQILAVDPEHPIIRIAPMEEVLADSVTQPRLMSWLLGIFGGLALGLAVLGVYGVIAYTVSLRTHEFGVRLALGAQPRHVLRLVLGDGMKWVSLGLGLGVLTALGLTRLLASLLYGITATDPITFGGVSVLLGLVGLLACYLPARRATRVDPLVALRFE